jgi:hypothetical protein
MHLVYIDEVKHAPPQQAFHWLGALAFAESTIQQVDVALNRLAETFFGTSVLSHNHEFHASHILHGKGPFKGRTAHERIELYKSLLEIINSSNEIGRIEIRIDPAKMIAPHYTDKAFMFLVEKVNDYMREKNSVALLIADDDKELAGQNVSSLSSYKANGTLYPFGKTIEHIVDTIHHTKSHHSRLLQLADVYVYTLAIAAGATDSYIRNRIVEHAKTQTSVLFPTKYKNWPTANSWYNQLEI